MKTFTLLTALAIYCSTAAAVDVPTASDRDIDAVNAKYNESVKVARENSIKTLKLVAVNSTKNGDFAGTIRAYKSILAYDPEDVVALKALKDIGAKDTASTAPATVKSSPNTNVPTLNSNGITIIKIPANKQWTAVGKLDVGDTIIVDATAVWNAHKGDAFFGPYGRTSDNAKYKLQFKYGDDILQMVADWKYTAKTSDVLYFGMADDDNYNDNQGLATLSITMIPKKK